MPDRCGDKKVLNHDFYKIFEIIKIKLSLSC